VAVEQTKKNGAANKRSIFQHQELSREVDALELLKLAGDALDHLSACEWASAALGFEAAHSDLQSRIEKGGVVFATAEQTHHKRDYRIGIKLHILLGRAVLHLGDSRADYALACFNLAIGKAHQDYHVMKPFEADGLLGLAECLLFLSRTEQAKADAEGVLQAKNLQGDVERQSQAKSILVRADTDLSAGGLMRIFNDNDTPTANWTPVLQVVSELTDVSEKCITTPAAAAGALFSMTLSDGKHFVLEAILDAGLESMMGTDADKVGLYKLNPADP
jgi:hypothetical protein